MRHAVKASVRAGRRAAARTFRGAGAVNWKGNGVVNLIDVGSVGQLPEPWHTNARSVKNVLKFEPRDRAKQQKHVRTVDAALWVEPGSRSFYIYRGLSGSGSSLFEPNFAYVDANFDTLRKRGPQVLADTWRERSQLERVETINCTTLDAVLATEPLRYDFLKIDAQGAEDEILKGARGFLGTDCVGLHLELFTVPLYVGIKLQDEVIGMLKDLGFSLVKTFPPHGTFDSQNDCVFLRDDARGAVAEAIRKIYALA